MKYKLKNIDSLSNKRVFVDTNVLIYLFWPLGQIRLERMYANAFSSLLKQNNMLFVDFLVISEAVNRIIRIEHKKSSSSSSFKQYRNSSKGQEALHDIYSIIKENVLPIFKIAGMNFCKEDIEQMLAIDQLDFVDKGIVSICEQNNFILLTHDRDFKDCGLDILSGNGRLVS